MNPKAYLFMFAIFPNSCVRNTAHSGFRLSLAIITAATQLPLYGGLALAAGSA